MQDPWEPRDIARVAVFAAIIVVLGLTGPIPVPGLVPITAQTAGVMLAGAVLGWKRSAAAILIVLALVAIGLPILSGGRGGLGVFVGPTAGFLLGWLPGAMVTGAISEVKSARVAFLCDSSANASCSSRVKWYLSAHSSPNTPIALPSYGLVRPSQAMWSTSLPSP